MKTNINKIRRRRNTLWGYGFTSPSAILLFVFIILPIFISAALSLTDFSGFNEPTYVGFKNYVDMFKDKKFLASMKNTFIYVIATVPLQTILSLVVAAILAEKFRNPFGEFIRGTMFIPVLCSAVIAGNLFFYLFASDKEAIVNSFMMLLGFKKVNWLGKSDLAMLVICIVAIWKNVGYFMVIFYAAIMDVPQTLHDAARVDGASPMQRFLHITMPGIRPVLYLVITLSTIWAFQVFDITMVMTKGGPGVATMSPVLLVYNYAFSDHRMGYASAIACLLAVVIFVISMLQKLVFREED
jgi:multiple sugar transport system permease protein